GGATVDADALGAHCRASLAGYKVPKRVLVVDSLQRSPAGKADYKLLRELAAERLRRDRGGSAGGTGGRMGGPRRGGRRPRGAGWRAGGRSRMGMFHGQGVPEVPAVDAESGQAGHILLDVRNADEWEAGHAPTAQWVPLRELASVRFQLPMNRRIVCVCRSG